MQRMFGLLFMVLLLGAIGVAGYAAPSSLTREPFGGEYGETILVSAQPDGTSGNDRAEYGSMDGTGRWITFSSPLRTLVEPPDPEWIGDVFLYDSLTGALERISVASDGTPGNGFSYRSFVSDDGRWLFFESHATNLTAHPTLGSGMYLRDRASETTILVSRGVDGVAVGGEPRGLSADGRVMAMESPASNLVKGDTNSLWDVFVYERDTAQMTRIVPGVGGTEANRHVYGGMLSADGQVVLLLSEADNLVVGDTNEVSDIFVYDRDTGITERVSLNSAGDEGNQASYAAAISADGRYVAFLSIATNLVSHDTNGYPDVFVRDRLTGETELVSVATDGTQSNGSLFLTDVDISGDGRYVVFTSNADTLVEGDSNGTFDVFRHDRVTGETRLFSISSTGTQADMGTSAPLISDDGATAIFLSYSDNLVPEDSNGFPDILRHAFSAEPPPPPATYTPTATLTPYPPPPQQLYLPIIEKS